MTESKKISYECPHCDYEAKLNKSLITHLAQIHDIGVKWYECIHCGFKAKEKSSLTGHLVYRHVPIVKWYPCPFDDHIAIERYRLKSHMLYKHDVREEDNQEAKFALERPNY